MFVHSCLLMLSSVSYSWTLTVITPFTLKFYEKSIFALFVVDLIMVWNVKYGTLQSWQTLDKITTKQHSIPRPVRSDGACCVQYIPGFISAGFHHSVAVCQFSMDACSLASALGQLDSTAK